MMQRAEQCSEPNAMMRQVDRCTACGSTSLTDFFEAKSQPVNVGVFFDSAEEAQNAPTADITLGYCRNCGLVFNRVFDPSSVVFKPGYEVALTHSAVFRDFIASVAQRLVERYELRNKTILEIGCGNGYFLRLICELGGNRGIGIDPTMPREGREQLERGSVEFIRDFYSEKYVGIQSDFVCCLSVFEDIPRPAEFLTTVRRMIGERPDVPLYFEVFNAYRAIEQRETWSIHYEQCNYFSPESMKSLFQRCGFRVTKAGACYQGGQYLYVEAIPSAEKRLASQRNDSSGSLPGAIAEFSDHHLAKLKYWNNRLSEFSRDNQRVVVWGTGGKGIGFLNTLDTRNVIQYVVEINPDKQGKFVPGSGQQIMPPAFLAQYKPDKVIITNALYLEEMREQAQQLGVSPEFLVA